jgi:hypothetical protein
MYGDIKNTLGEQEYTGKASIIKERAAIGTAVDEHDVVLERINSLVTDLFEKFSVVLADEPSLADGLAQAAESLGSSQLYRKLESQNFTANVIADRLLALYRQAEV